MVASGGTELSLLIQFLFPLTIRATERTGGAQSRYKKWAPHKMDCVRGVWGHPPHPRICWHFEECSQGSWGSFSCMHTPTSCRLRLEVSDHYLCQQHKMQSKKAGGLQSKPQWNYPLKEPRLEFDWRTEQVRHCLGAPLHWEPGANCPCCPPCQRHCAFVPHTLSNYLPMAAERPQ